MFLRASWGSAVLGVAALLTPWFAYPGIVCWFVALGAAALDGAGERLILLGHGLSGLGLVGCFLALVLIDAPDALLAVPLLFGLGQVPVLFALLLRLR
ncbi:hypothetical protein [Corynebacterium nasicanis]|uniref:Uncharacterized protein n=1 Tax=Corynebacterium nasicanis TaxID=1448267 RepID=A0ABW1QA47_9CORY